MAAPWPMTALLSRGHCQAPLSVQTQGCQVCVHGHRTPSEERRHSGGAQSCHRQRWGEALTWACLAPPRTLSPQAWSLLGWSAPSAPPRQGQSVQVVHAGWQDPAGGEGMATHRLGGQAAQGHSQALIHLLSCALQAQAATRHRQGIPWGGQQVREGGGGSRAGGGGGAGQPVPENTAGGSGHSSSHRK